MESNITRPAAVWISQIMLVATALFIMCLPFLSSYSVDKTFEYYGVTPSQAQGHTTQRFFTSFVFLIPPLIAIAIASWGMIKGNRTGRLVAISIFIYVALTLALDPLWPYEVLRFSEYGTVIPFWAENTIKLLLAALYVFLVYHLSYGRTAKLYFARHSVKRYTDPPPPPSFEA